MTGKWVTTVVTTLDRPPGLDECRTKLRELASAYHSLGPDKHTMAGERLIASYKRYARALTQHTGESVCPIYLTR